MLSFLLSLLAAGPSPGLPPLCAARLEIQRRNGVLIITGYCRNLLATAGRYRYELATERQSGGNHAQNRQHGEFAVAPNQAIALSQTQINASLRDAYRIFAAHS